MVSKKAIALVTGALAVGGAAVYFSHNPFSPYFSYSYGRIDYRGKTVVDIGAFDGDSASFFLNRGATSVIAFESDQRINAKLIEKFKDDRRVVAMGSWNGQPIYGDVLKMDCEGCEVNLTQSLLAQYPEYVIGLHPDALGPQRYESIVKMIAATGGDYWGMEYFWSREMIFGKKLRTI